MHIFETYIKDDNSPPIVTLYQRLEDIQVDIYAKLNDRVGTDNTLYSHILCERKVNIRHLSVIDIRILRDITIIARDQRKNLLKQSDDSDDIVNYSYERDMFQELIQAYELLLSGLPFPDLTMQ